MVSHDQTFPRIVRSRLLLGIIITKILQRPHSIISSQHRPLNLQPIMERFPIMPTEIPNSTTIAIQPNQLQNNLYQSRQSMLR